MLHSYLVTNIKNIKRILSLLTTKIPKIVEKLWKHYFRRFSTICVWKRHQYDTHTYTSRKVHRVRVKCVGWCDDIHARSA